MPKLNQIIAVEKQIKSDTIARETNIYRQLGKAPLLSGISRTYRPLDEDGEQFPPESTKVQVKANDLLDQLVNELTKMFDIVATKEFGNTEASADVVVDGNILVRDIPVGYLLFLEKQLTDLHTLVRSLPVLDPSDEWHLDENVGVYATPPVETVKTKKIPRNHVKAPATDKHPAQVEIYHEDVVVGYWKKISFSGALPQTRVNELVYRVEKLQAAVKFAREQANSTEVSNVEVGRDILNYIFN